MPKPALLLLSFAVVACTEAEGTLEVRVWGEDFIEEGIPTDVFNDGWSVEFSRFLVVIDAIGTEGNEPDPGRYAFDLVPATDGRGHPIVELGVASGTQSLEYRIGPGPVAVGGNATESDAAMMAAMGYSIYVEGTATDGAATVSFAWGFDSDTTYHACEVVDRVPADGESTTTITIHADHILVDDLESTMPNTSFALVAASDLDMDGEVTEAELLARDISAEARYQVGSHDVFNLWDFMTVLSGTVGHIDGEGECQI